MTSQDIKRKVMERNLSLIGYAGLSNVYHCLQNVKLNKINGDFVETGVWKGGASLYARAVMNELGIEGKVYVCDSFRGVPKPDVVNFPLDEGDYHYEDKALAISREEVEGYFKEFDLLDGTEFVEGWFKDTMPPLKDKIEKIAVLRLDGDMYQSTIEVLDALYDKVVPLGLVIVDDYGLDRCKWAIDDFFEKRRIKEELRLVEHTMTAIWQKR